MKLLGSTTSPYVRKVRIILNEYNHEYEFDNFQSLSPEGVAKLKSYGSIIRVPILLVEDKSIYDSSIIAEYLLELNGIKLSIDDKLKLRLIDELCDSGVILFQSKMWDIDKNWTNKLSEKMYNRYCLILNELEETLEQLTDLQKDWLFCVIDWLLMREIFEFGSNYKNLQAFYNRCKSLKKFQDTEPRI